MVGVDVVNIEYKFEDGFVIGFFFKLMKVDEDIEYIYVYSEAGIYMVILVVVFVGCK